jgi:hypothetical protein
LSNYTKKLQELNANKGDRGQLATLEMLQLHHDMLAAELAHGSLEKRYNSGLHAEQQRELLGEGVAVLSRQRIRPSAHPQVIVGRITLSTYNPLAFQGSAQTHS